MKDNIKTAEEIYEEYQCSKKLDILEAMREYATQYIDLAAEEAKAYVNYDDEAKVIKESILKVKQLIK